MGDEDIAVSGHTAIIQHKQNAKYLSYYFHTSHFFTQKKKLAHGTKVIEISPKGLANVIIPIPSLTEQQRIVDILDRFDKLTNDITSVQPLPSNDVSIMIFIRTSFRYSHPTILNSISHRLQFLFDLFSRFREITIFLDFIEDT